MRTAKRRSRWKRFLLGFVGALLLPASLSSAAVGSQDDDPRLRTAMAAYLVNFALHVRWPEGAGRDGAPLTIAVLGHDRMGELLDRAAEGRTAEGRPLRVVRAERLEDLGPSDLIFLDGPGLAEVEAVVRATAGRPVLVVAFTQLSGGTVAAIDLVLVRDGTLRYKLAAGRLRAAGLTPSSGLLELALRGEERSRLLEPERRLR